MPITTAALLELLSSDQLVTATGGTWRPTSTGTGSGSAPGWPSSEAPTRPGRPQPSTGPTFPVKPQGPVV